MSNKHERICEIKSHINQLLSELRRIEPNDSNLEKHRSFTQISSEQYLFDCHCPYLSRQQTIFHSTAYHDYKKLQHEQQQQQHKESILSPKKHFLAFARATSTPKTSPNDNHLLLKPYRTSTPRRHQRSSTNFIPLKRLLYNQHPSDKDTHRLRYTTKRSIFPRSNLRDNQLQWI